MRKMNLYDAKTHFSKVISHVAETGETYIIARNGKPVAKIVPLAPSERTSRIGFLKGKISAPDHFNAMNAEDIADLFNGD